MTENKRRYVRISKSLTVSFQQVEALLRSSTRSKNISETGICIPCDRNFPVDSLLEIAINYDELKPPIKALVRVARIADRNDRRLPFEVGLEFVEISPSERERLHDYICAQGEQEIRWDA